MDHPDTPSAGQTHELLARIESDLHLLIRIAERQAHLLDLIAAKLS